MAADDLREALQALVAECERGTVGLFPHGRVALDFTGKPFGSFVAVDRLRALLDAHPAPSEPEATVVEEWQTVPSDWTSLASHVRGHRSRREAEAVRGVSTGERKLMRRARTTYADRVTEWETV